MKRRILAAAGAVSWLLLAAEWQGGVAEDISTPVPSLAVRLAPGAPDAQDNISYVDVEIAIDELKAKAKQPFLELPLVSSNVQGVADALTGFRVRDARGPLRLTQHDDAASTPAAYRHWSPARDAYGPVTLDYRVPITNALNPRGAAPPLEVRTEGGGFSGAGGIFLVLPETKTPYRISVKWNLSQMRKGAVGLSSLGPADVTLTSPQPASFLASTFFMGGVIGHFPANLSAEGFASAWQGGPPFDAHALMQWTDGLYAHYLAFFHAPTKQFYAVFLRRNPVNAGGGVEIGHSFVGTFDKNTKPEDLKLTLAHEMVHTFVGALDGQDELALSWYSEGLAVYYQRLLPRRFGLISVNAYLADLNQTAGRYYTDLLNGTPNDQISARFWADTRVRVLPYDRGAMYFAALNAQLRKTSGGKRSLDDLVSAMIDRRARGLSVDEAAWIALLRQELGEAGVKSFRDMLAGKLVVPESDAFGPCFSRTTAVLRRYDLGFDPGVLVQPKRIVHGLVAGSAAAKAALRDGDEIVKPVPQDAIQADQHATLTLLIRRDGQQFPITYLPRGEQVQAYQWERVSGKKDETCRNW